MTKVTVMTWMLLVAQFNVNAGGDSEGTPATFNSTTTDVKVTRPNGTTQVTVKATDISSSNTNVSETTSTNSTELGNTTITTTTTETMSTTKAMEEASTQSLQQSTTTIKNACSTSSFGPSKMNFNISSLIAMSAAGGVIVLSVIWSIFICCWYRRKFNRLLSEKKSENDAEKSVLLHEMNGRKTSAVTYRGNNVDKDLSSGVLSTHSKADESDERMSDLYDVTDPDYEDADKEIKVKISEKSRKVNDDDEVEDGEYDILNIEDKKEKRESDYACAEFKKSKDDVDCDTYDTTETCKRIVCNGNHKHGNGETEHRLENSDQSEGREATKHKNADSSESNGQIDLVSANSENKTVVSKDTNEEIKFLENANLNNIEEGKCIKSDEKEVKKETSTKNKSAFNGYELVKLVDEKDDSVKSDVRNSKGETKKDETLEKTNTSLETIEV